MDTIENAQAFVSDLLKDKLSVRYCYHNLEHTLRVVAASNEISEAEKVTEDEKTALQLAAWFHDTGYISGPENHEKRSVDYLREFVNGQEIDPKISKLAEKLILATEYQRKPQDKLEYIIRDADTAHFATDDFLRISDLLRKEWENEGKVFKDLDWFEGNVEMLTKKHRFYSDYAKKHWQQKKDDNTDFLSGRIAAIKAQQKKLEDIPKEEVKQKRKRVRGVETMFKTTAENHTQLSQIADSKANILLSVNAIIISISLSTLIPKLYAAKNEHLMIPTFILLFFSVIVIIFAILSTRPKINSGSFTREGILNREVNLLFFGNFHKMPYEEYEWAMNEVMKDPEYLYNSMIKDLYYLGLVLKRKYTLLRITYNIFMVGIVISSIAFVLAFLVNR
jgi:predicted metal-dependent HD superfamily phosphohydrolase